MEKQIWKPGNMLYPLPAVMVSCAGKDGKGNIITVGWAGTVCTNPAMVFISLRPQRYSYELIKESGCFVINLTTEKLTRAMDYCGVRSGRDVDKFAQMKLTAAAASKVSAPMIGESPVNIECTVQQVLPLGSHHMFLAKVEAVHVDEQYIDETGKFDLNKAGLVAYSHGSYFALGEQLGTFGYSVRKKAPDPAKSKEAYKKETAVSVKTKEAHKKETAVSAKTKEAHKKETAASAKIKEAHKKEASASAERNRKYGTKQGAPTGTKREYGKGRAERQARRADNSREHRK